MLKRGIGFLVVLALLSMLFVSAMASAQDGEPGPLQPWEIVQKSDGGYNVIALHEEMGEGIRKHVHDLLIQEFGEKALHWTVQEADGIQYVYAYPYVDSTDNASFRQRISREILEFPAGTGQ